MKQRLHHKLTQLVIQIEGDTSPLLTDLVETFRKFKECYNTGRDEHRISGFEIGAYFDPDVETLVHESQRRRLCFILTMEGCEDADIACQVASHLTEEIGGAEATKKNLVLLQVAELTLKFWEYRGENQIK